MTTWTARMCLMAALVPLLLPTLTPQARADDLVWRIGSSVIEEPKYKEGFARFDYVNPDAPKGGTLRLSEMDSFDTLNPILAKGDIGAGIADVYETLMKPSLDEVSTRYGLLAEALAYPDDYSFVKFRLNAKAKWADGEPVTPEDVVFSFDKSKELNPQRAVYYAHVTKAEKTGDREVTFTFDQKNNRELPNILGELQIVPKHWWEGKDANGKQRNIGETTLEPIMGSGPYKITSVIAGSKITLALRDDYWGKDLNVNIGYNNFATVEHSYFSDRDVEFEAFRSHNVDFWNENAAVRWATQYDFPAVKDGRVKRDTPDNGYRSSGVMVGFIPNLRREKFKDVRVREALNYAFDFEELNRTIFFQQYSRISSFFYGSALASSGLPEGREKEILTELKDQIPPAALTTEYKNPVGGDPANLRNNLKAAIALFKEAGYELKGGKMTDVKTGKPFTFEVMLNGPIIERVALPWATNLKKIGIDVDVRSVDASQFINRQRSRDYDVIYTGWAQSLNPGNEQAEYWGSKAGSTEGSANYSGIATPGLDTLINKIIFAKDRDEQVATVKALDRVLLASHIVIPTYTIRKERIAWWDGLEHPDYPYYSTGFPDIWWFRPQAK